MKTLLKKTGSISRIILLMLLSISGSLTVQAAPLKFVPQILKQPNGEIFNCFVSGDEYFSWLHDKDGYTIITNQSGYYVYAVKDGPQLIPSNHIVGMINPELFGLEKWAKPEQSYILNQVKAVKQINDSFRKTGNSDNTASTNSAPTTGNLFNLVVFIRFADDAEFSQPLTTFNSMFNDAMPSANSVRNYYNEVSYGQLNIQSSFYPATNNSMTVSYKDSHIRNYYSLANAANPYGYQNGLERTEREHNLLENAINSITENITSADSLDGNNDGLVDNVCFIVKGSVEFWSSLLWPHMWSLESRNLMILGKKITVYNFQIEQTLLSSGVGVLSHELFHSMGAPDLYNYVCNPVQPVGSWDLMAYTANPPQHMSAYMKFRYGHWISSIPMIISSGNYSLKPLTCPVGNCFKIQSPNNIDEYFIVEYRKKQGIFESTLPGSGLLVSRINSARDGMGNAFDPAEVYIFRPQGTMNLNGIIDSAHFNMNSGRVTLNDNTDPYTFLSNGLPGGLDLYEIGEIQDSLIFKMHQGEPFSLSLTAPVGGENFKINTQTKISWLNNTGISTVTIEYTTNGNDWTIIETLPGQAVLASGQYLWSVPDTLTNTARVRVSDACDLTYYSMSKSCFAISNHGQLYEIEPNNTVSESNPIVLEDQYEGEISTPEDADYYKFFANAGDTVDVFANAKNSVLSGRIRLFNFDGSQQWYGDGTYENSIFKQRVSLLIPTTGDYYIRYSNKNNWGIFPAKPTDYSQYKLFDNSRYSSSSSSSLLVGGYKLSLKKFEPSMPYIGSSGVGLLTLNAGGLNASIRTNGSPTLVSFEYGTDVVYGNSVDALPPNPFNIMSQDWLFQADIFGLLPNTTYHYRVVASNAFGVVYSKDATFTTAAEPSDWERQIIPTNYGLITYMPLGKDTGITFKNNFGVNMYKTTDGGEHWNTLPFSAPNYCFLHGTFVNNHCGWIVGNGIFKSTDGGLTWQEQNNPINKVLCGVSFFDEDHGIAVGYQGSVITTSNGGNTWIVRDSGTVNSMWFRLWKVQLLSANHGFAVGDEGTALRTYDGGISWDTLNCGTSAMFNNLFFIDSLNGYIVGDGYCGGGGVILHTADGGDTWISQNNPTSNYLYGVSFYNSNHGIVAGINGAIAVTHDGGNMWSAQESGVRSTLSDVKFLDSTSAVIVGGGGIILKTIDQNKKTIQVKSPVGDEIWPSGSVQNIIWQKNNISHVNILYSTDPTHETWDTVAVNVLASVNSYRWLIPDTPSEDCLIRICDASSDTVSGISDTTFTISLIIPETLNVAGTLTQGMPLCYNATNSVNVAGSGTTFTIQNGGNASIIAGQNIIFHDGASVESGGYLHGYIASGGPYCSSMAPSIVTAPIAVEEIVHTSNPQFFKVYPNPTTGLFIVELAESAYSEKNQIEIYDILGSKIKTTTLSGERKHEFTLSDKLVGVYFIRVISDDKAETVKIIKQ